MDALFKAPGALGWFAATVAIPEYSFISASTREFGRATIGFSFDDPVIRNGAISEIGGTLVKIPHEQLGDWLGVQIEPLRQTDQGWEMTAHQIGILLRNRLVPNVFVPQGAPAGLIAEAAIRESIRASSSTPLTSGSYLVAAPVIEGFTAAYRPLIDVLADLADQSGQEWEITEDLVINWVSSAGRLFDDVLVEGRDLAFIDREVDASPLVGRVIARGTNGATRTATAEELIGNPTAREIGVSVSVTSPTAIQVAANRRLDLGRSPTIRYTFGLVPHFEIETILITDPEPQTLLGAGQPLFGGGEELEAQIPPMIPGGTALMLDWPTWAIREGDLVSCVVPSAGLAGETILGRVLSRTYGDAYEYPVITVHWVPRVDDLTLPVILSTQTVHYARPESWNRKIAALAAAADAERPKDLVPDSQIISVSGDKVTGPLPTDTMQNNVVAAVNANGSALSEGVMQTNVGAALNASSTTITAARYTGSLVGAFNGLAGFNIGQMTAGTLDVTNRIANGAIGDAKISDVDETKINWTMSGSAGTASGEYIVVNTPLGQRKIELRNVS